MSKILKIFFTILALAILGLFLHFDVFYQLPYISNFHENSVLTINSRRGISNIYVNETDYGETPQSISNLPEGGYNVELERISESSDVYQKQNFYVELHRNTEAVIDVEIAPNNFKSGHILYYSPIANVTSNYGAITVRSDLDDYDVTIDGKDFEQEELVSFRLKPKEYDIVVKADGYEGLEFPAIVREGYDLNIRVYLLPKPIVF